MTQGNIAPIQEAPNPIDPGVRIGHVHLRTADIDRGRAFYVDVLGYPTRAGLADAPGPRVAASLQTSAISISTICCPSPSRKVPDDHISRVPS